MFSATPGDINAADHKDIAYRLADQLGQALLAKSWLVTTAESCTGGMIASAITDIAGSSTWFEQGAVTYSNRAKQQLLGVNAEIFSHHGAVSQACVRAMASGALRCSGADVAVAVSGVAGPEGGTVEKPVGTVWISWALRQRGLVDAEVFQFAGNRQQVRQQAVASALHGTIARVKNAGK